MLNKFYIDYCDYKMGNQLAGIAPSQIYPVEHYLTELPDFTYESNLGSTRFFKVAKTRHKEGLTVVKVFAIHDPSLPLRNHRDRLEEIRSLLINAPNCLPFQRAMLTEKAGILVRQYVKDNLYDRISTRPFLNAIEKRWIAFQLFCALSHCHGVGVCHGDIKLENIMVTGWNWVLLTDFASFKPTYLPEDNPADFSYFFDTSRRRTCYIAPERFVKTLNSEGIVHHSSVNMVLPEEEMKTGDITPSMDIFSLGCVLTELFTEGNYSPFDFSQLLAYHSGEYSPWKVLEKMDDVFIRELVRHMIQKDPNKRLSADEYLEQQKGKAFPEYFYSFLKGYMEKFATSPVLSPDEKIAIIKRDTNVILNALQLKNEGKDCNETNEGIIIIVSLITSCLRGLKHCTAKLNSLEIIHNISSYLSPEIILDRLLPYMIYLSNDCYPRVRIASLQTLTHCLTQVKSIPRSDANVFPEYILPNLARITQDEAVLVRVAYAENIAELAETALRFLEMTHLETEQTETEQSNSENTYIQTHHHYGTYGSELQALQEMIQQSVSTLLSDPDNIIKQTLLERGITRLCVFFGRQKANDVLLSHMITFLNDKEDRHLRGAFFDAIVGVATYVGWQCCPILKPLLQQGLADAEEFVISKALHAMTDLTELGLMQKQMLYDLVAETVPLLFQPNLWIRHGTVGFICAVSKLLNLADIQCKLMPLLQSYLKYPIIQIDQEVVLLNALKEPLFRSMYDYLIKLPLLPTLLESLRARQISRSIARSGHLPSYGDLDVSLKAVYRRLQSDGMTEEIEEKILVMKEHLLKMHKNHNTIIDPRGIIGKEENGIIDLFDSKLNIQLHVVELVRPEREIETQVSLPIKNLGKKKGVSLDSPNITMNEEWQHMFGASEPPLSPKLQSQISDSANSQSQKLVSASKPTVQDSSEFNGSQTLLTNSTLSSGMSSVKTSSTSDSTLKSHHCVSCKNELQVLICHKQEQNIRDEAVRLNSEDINREPKISLQKWKPKGILAAHLHEHQGSVNRLQVIPDSSLFATCSSDGTIKIWDCAYMEKRSVVNRSRQTYNRLGGKINCMTICQNLQSLAASSDNGNIHVFRIEHNSQKTTILTSRNLDPQEEGSVVDMHYLDAGLQSVLAYATVYGSIVGWDLRSPGTAWKLDNNPKHGLITSFCVDTQHCWLLLGTAGGHLVCWDLRFRLPITTIVHPTGARVRRLLLHPHLHSSAFSAVQGNNEVSLWDLESGARTSTLWASSAPPLSQTLASKHATYSMYVGYTDRGIFLITAGSDMRIRYWDIDYAADSYIIAGAANDPLNAPAVSYLSRLIDGTEVIQETHGKSRPPNTEDPPWKYPETPAAGHHDCISDVSMIQTTQNFLLSASKDGVVKIWK